MKKIISCILVLTMVVSVMTLISGCGGEDAETAAKKTFTVYGVDAADNPEHKDVVEFYQKKWAANCPDYDIEWIGGDIQMIMASGDFPDIITKVVFQNLDVAKYASQGILVPLEEYITEENTPNICRMFKEQPTTKAIATSPDGHIYALPNYSGDGGASMETYWWINKAWLDKLGLEIPTTLPELKEVLVAFKTKDPNGNGKADEIPMTFYNEGAYTYPETLLSCWGVSTKFGMYDSYLNVQNGKVNFTPMMDEWKKMIKFYAELYKEGLLDVECFTYKYASFSSRLSSEVPVVGVTFNMSNPFGVNADQYEVIPPISADGKIKPVVHIHPGVIGTRNVACITSNCEDPKAAMAWLDTFYSKEATITNWYGVTDDEANGKIKASFHKEGELYMWNDYAEQGYKSISEMYYGNSPSGPHILGYMNLNEDRGTIIEDNDVFRVYDELWEMYEPYIDKETWPRPYYDPEDSSRLSVIQTDLFNYVEKKKADWIMGRVDVESDWQNYLAELKELGADELLEINQRTYDIYQEIIDEVKK